VDLGTGEISREPLNEDFLMDYIGGTGLGVRMLYDELKPGTDPLAPENPLVFTTGPLTGTLVPGSGTYTVSSKNVLTGLAAVTQANGFFGARLKNAGYDALIVQGRSATPVYLHIHDGEAELLDASALAGKSTFETDTILRKKHGEPEMEDRISIAAIGPAGENLVRFACIVSDRGHVAATGGLGAVMGSKNLKAVVAHGLHGVPIDPARAHDFFRLARQWREEAANTSMGKAVSRHGTLGWFIPYHSRGWVPVKNLTTNVFPGEERFQAEEIRGKIYRMQPRSCHGCTFAHCHVVEVMKGKYKGTVGEEPEYEIMAGFGPNWGIHDPGAVAFLNHLNDGLGMDAKEVSFLISMVMEGVEKGLIGKAEMGGIAPGWGDVEGAAELLERISRREGFGDILSQGVMRAAHHLGGSFPEMAVYVKKGCAPHIHDPRTRWGTLFNQVISNMGSQEGIDMTMRFSTELGLDRPASEPDEYVALVQSKTGPKRQFEECLGFCYFQASTLQTMIDTLNCLTGTSHDKESCLKIGRRVVNLLRMFNKREGMTREDDGFSPRLARSPTDGPGAGKSLAPNFEEIRQAYYGYMGWDEEGMPTTETLKELGLEFTISTPTECPKNIRYPVE
jgi:aldehyde:ferredoxin oxidoreductase